jgi:parallel beta-helix repeat protein
MLRGRNCIYIHDTTSSFILRDSQFIFDLTVTSEIGSSVIRLENIEDGVIENCYIRGGDIAIELRGATNCVIKNCIAFDAYRGILLDSSSNCTILECSCSNNSIGTMIVNSDSCNIINNSIYSNYQRGIHVEVFSENITIFGNAIGWNTVENAMDSGENTIFTDSISIGNEWSDYNSSEDYSIDGTGGSTDPYATLLIDADLPIVLHEPDSVIDIESNDESISWSASDKFPERYQVYINDVLKEESAWDGSDIVFSLDYLTEGTYNITLNAMDGAGNAGRDEVVVSVISFILGGIGTELVMYASGATLVCFVVIILLVKRFT